MENNIKRDAFDILIIIIQGLCWIVAFSAIVVGIYNGTSIGELLPFFGLFLLLCICYYLRKIYEKLNSKNIKE